MTRLLWSSEARRLIGLGSRVKSPEFKRPRRVSHAVTTLQAVYMYRNETTLIQSFVTGTDTCPQNIYTYTDTTQHADTNLYVHNTVIIH